MIVSMIAPGAPSAPRPITLRRFAEQEAAGDTVYVSTDCLYPDGQSVTIAIRWSGNGDCQVSDDEGGWHLLCEHVIEPSAQAASGVAHVVSQRTGVDYINRRWVMPNVPIEHVESAVLFVANASQEWVRELYRVPRADESERLDDALFVALAGEFGPSRVVRRPKLTGASLTAYDFTAAVRLGRDRLAAFETTARSGPSINAAYRKLRDVSDADDRPAFLSAVIDKAAAWRDTDVSLLRSAATSVIDLSAEFRPQTAQLARAIV